MWIHTVRWMQLETVLAELPADWKQSHVPPVGKGKEGEEKGTSTAAFRKADTAGTEGRQARAHCKGTGSVWHKRTG